MGLIKELLKAFSYSFLPLVNFSILIYNSIMKIYIVRHGESEGNAKGFVSYSHTPMTSKGHREAKKLGEKLVKEGIKIDKIYCSTLYRSLQTLEDLLKAGLKVDEKNIELTDLLREINRKKFEGRNKSEYYSKKDASKSPDDYRCQGGESENDVKKRAQEFIKIISKTKDKNILIISHGHFLKHFTSLLTLVE